MGRPRLLVVDGDPCTRMALHTLFSRQGWQVRLATSLAEGLASLAPAPHCVILDLDLPDGPGEAILRRVRSECPGIRVAACSASDDPARLAVVRGLAPDLLLWKPIEMASVFRLCEEARAASA